MEALSSTVNFSQAQKSVMGIDKKTLNIVYQVDWDKRRPKFKGLSQETVLLEDDYQALHLLSTNKEKAVERYAKWYFFPTAFLRQKNDGTLLKQGDVNNYLHWVKNGQIKKLEGLWNRTIRHIWYFATDKEVVEADLATLKALLEKW